MIHVADVGLDEADDLKIWQYAKENKLDILSKDADFNDLQQLKGYPPKIVWIRSGNVTTSYIIQLLRSRKIDIVNFLNDNSPLNSANSVKRKSDFLTAGKRN